ASKCVAGWLAVTGLMCATVICGQEVGAPATPPKPKTVEITPTNIQAHVGDKIKFTAVAKDDAGKTIDVKPMLWIALPPDIPGFARVTVGTPPPVAVEVTPVKQALVVGGSTVLTATARSANGDPRTDVPIHWTSKAPAIATVDDSGLVKALAPGTAAVMATAGPARGEITVQVVADTLRRILLEQT